MRTKLILLFTLTITATYAQNPRVDPNPSSIYQYCDLQRSNETWWREMGAENNPSRKIEMVKQKINSDTKYKVNPSFSTKYDQGIATDHVDSQGNLCGVKLLFILVYAKNKNLTLDLLKSPEYNVLIKKLNETNTTVSLLNPNGGTALYGFAGSAGVVVVNFHEKALDKEIKSMRW